LRFFRAYSLREDKSFLDVGKGKIG
jgi:hypothetical protein